MTESAPPKKPKSKHVEPLIDTTTGEWKESIEFNFPPFAVIYDHSGRIIVGGGGGASKTGVPNKLILLESATSHDLKAENGGKLENAQASAVLPSAKSKSGNVVLLRKVCVYDTGSDAIMNMALHPIENLLACGVGDRCRVYNVGYRSFQPIGEVQTDFAENEEDRGQKRVRFSPKGNFMFCAGGDGCVRMFSFPELQLVRTFAAHSLEKETETIDLTVTGNMLAALSRRKCLVYDIQTGSLLHSIEPSDRKLSFRDSRFCPILSEATTVPSSSTPLASTFSRPLSDESTPHIIYDDHLDEPSPLPPLELSKQTTVATETARSDAFVPDSRYLYTTEFIPKQNGVVKKWDLKTWKCVRSKTIRFNSDHLTAFGVSPDGSTLAVGTVEGQLRVLNSFNFSEVYRDTTKHEFFVTDFAFDSPLAASPSLSEVGGNLPTGPSKPSLPRSPKNRVLFSASGDNTLRATLIPNLSGNRRRKGPACLIFGFFMLVAVIFGFVIAMLVLAQRHRPDDLQLFWRLVDSYGLPTQDLASHVEFVTNRSSIWLDKPLSVFEDTPQN